MKLNYAFFIETRTHQFHLQTNLSPSVKTRLWQFKVDFSLTMPPLRTGGGSGKGEGFKPAPSR